ncbi:tRNA glutamyl-Q(34) synthetase GluQRS [Porticoccus sp. W117]|uniref:tRNA glutamyl-Q(34) synthetase GluQRS n=1 Tax=Porticoccus sp. W117 TaxID=3054777 RepID=UPI002595AC54|nr:tRNA glutamyl-Q(34) synthetase GluQRS [Porticoccus sp. W117]MDM3872200.1 tRNA glutamyl-Q(34) synthetase GluQRS [Porticoccus sp. W117]
MPLDTRGEPSPRVSIPMPAYIGRFAPTPSGPLHFGSLVAALASYLDAKHHNGRWLVRIDDIDPPREVPGAADTILRQLEAHGLTWDGEVLYQSARNDAYRAALDKMDTYSCDCSRQAIKVMGGRYNGHCRQRQLPPPADYALRVKVAQPTEIVFDDRIQGPQRWPVKTNGNDDFIVWRRDGLVSYQLACAVDDLYQGITHVVRGQDLLDSTPKQLYLMQQLATGKAMPNYAHIKLVMGEDGQKLSKQNLSPAIEKDEAAENLYRALCHLGLQPPEEYQSAPVEALIQWGVANWS